VVVAFADAGADRGRIDSQMAADDVGRSRLAGAFDLKSETAAIRAS